MSGVMLCIETGRLWADRAVTLHQASFQSFNQHRPRFVRPSWTELRKLKQFCTKRRRLPSQALAACCRRCVRALPLFHSGPAGEASIEMAEHRHWVNAVGPMDFHRLPTLY